MGLSFENASLLSCSYQNNIQAEYFVLNRTNSFTVKGYLNTGDNPDAYGVSETYSKLNDFLNNGHDFWEDNIEINGIDFGKGRVTSISFNRPNPVLVDEYEVNIEVYDSGSLWDDYLGVRDAHGVGGQYSGYVQAFSGNAELSKYITSFSDSISMSKNEQGGFDTSHNVSFQLIGADSDNVGPQGNPITVDAGSNEDPLERSARIMRDRNNNGSDVHALKLVRGIVPYLLNEVPFLFHGWSDEQQQYLGGTPAKSLFNDWFTAYKSHVQNATPKQISSEHPRDDETPTAEGFVGSYLNDAYKFQKKAYYDESIDLLNLKFDFSKKYTTLGADEGYYSNSFNHTLSQDEMGNVTVTENGQIKLNVYDHDPSSISELELAYRNVMGSQEQDENTPFHRCAKVFYRALKLDYDRRVLGFGQAPITYPPEKRSVQDYGGSSHSKDTRWFPSPADHRFTSQSFTTGEVLVDVDENTHGQSASSYEEIGDSLFRQGGFHLIGAESLGRKGYTGLMIHPTPLSLSKTIDSGAGVINYSTTYSNQPSIRTGSFRDAFSDYGYDYKHTFSQTCSVGEDGITTVSENGTIIPIATKSQIRNNFLHHVDQGPKFHEHASEWARPHLTGFHYYSGVIKEIDDRAKSFYRAHLLDDPSHLESNTEKLSVLLGNGNIVTYVDDFLMTSMSVLAPRHIEVTYDETLEHFVPITQGYPTPSGELKLTNRSYSFNQWGGVNYTHNFSDDPTIFTLKQAKACGIRKLDISVNDTAPVLTVNNYLIPNKGEINHYGVTPQTQMGTRKVSVSAVKRRTHDSDLADISNIPNVDNEIQYLIEEGYEKLSAAPFENRQINYKDGWVNELTYNISSQGDIQVNMGMQYTAAREKIGEDGKILADKLVYNSPASTGSGILRAPINSKVLGNAGTFANSGNLYTSSP